MSIITNDLKSSHVLLHLKKDLKNPNVYYLPQVASRDGRLYDLKIEVQEGSVLNSAFYLKKEEYLEIVTLFSKITASQEAKVEGGFDRKGSLFTRKVTFCDQGCFSEEIEDSLKDEFKKVVLEPLFGAFAMKKLFAKGTRADLIFKAITQDSCT